MLHTPLRGLYGSKPKNVATVSPVLDDDDENPPDGGNNLTALSSPPFCIVDKHEVPPLSLQTKSSLRPSSASILRFPFGRGSNQDDPDASAVSEKYAVLGQKQHWRRTRSQRTKGPATIRHVGEDEMDASNDEDRNLLGERASSYLSTDRSERPDIPTLASLSARSSPPPSQLSSRESSRPDSSGFSSGRRSGDESNRSERELFVVTRQKKCRYAAKLYMPGQNPLYLGRYRSEEMARAACEEAYATITTPRK